MILRFILNQFKLSSFHWVLWTIMVCGIWGSVLNAFWDLHALIPFCDCTSESLKWSGLLRWIFMQMIPTQNGTDYTYNPVFDVFSPSLESKKSLLANNCLLWITELGWNIILISNVTMNQGKMTHHHLLELISFAKRNILISNDVWSLGIERKYDLVVRYGILFLGCVDFLLLVAGAVVLCLHCKWRLTKLSLVF